MFDAPVVCATMMGRLSAAASDSDDSGVATSGPRPQLVTPGADVGVGAGDMDVEQQIRPGAAFSDSDEENSGWDTSDDGEVANMLSELEGAFCVDALDLGHVSTIQHRSETGEDDAPRRLGADTHRSVEFAVGDWVLVHDLALGHGRGTAKFSPTFSKPVQVVAKVAPLLYDVRYQDRQSCKVVRIHVQRLQLYRPHPGVRGGWTAAAADPGDESEGSEGNYENKGMTGDEGSASEADAAARGTEDTEEGAEDDESQAHQADLSMYRVLKSDVRDNVLVFNEPGGFAVWLRESVVPDAALANFRSHARDRQWRKQVQRRLKCLTVLNEPGGVGGERPRGGRLLS